MLHIAKYRCLCMLRTHYLQNVRMFNVPLYNVDKLVGIILGYICRMSLKRSPVYNKSAPISTLLVSSNVVLSLFFIYYTGRITRIFISHISSFASLFRMFDCDRRFLFIVRFYFPCLGSNFAHVYTRFVNFMAKDQEILHNVG